jgi:hypothetical protein
VLVVVFTVLPEGPMAFSGDVAGGVDVPVEADAATVAVEDPNVEGQFGFHGPA